MERLIDLSLPNSSFGIVGKPITIWYRPLSASGLGPERPSNVTPVAIMELYAHDADGSGAPRKVNAPFPDGMEMSSYVVTPDSSAVLYRAGEDLGGFHGDLFQVPLNGPEHGRAVRRRGEQAGAVRRECRRPNVVQVAAEVD